MTAVRLDHNHEFTILDLSVQSLQPYKETARRALRKRTISTLIYSHSAKSVFE